ncbi:MAG: DUF3800 domain-containing protein [Candidatus Neomarinimicrobiota bacterium]
MYIDESGDPGWPDSTKPASEQPSPYFALSGLIIPANEWRNYLTMMVDIRRNVKTQFGFPVRAELKGSELINPRGNLCLKKMTRKKRVKLYALVLDSIASSFTQARLINVYLDKNNPRHASTNATKDIEILAWARLIQRFDMFLRRNGNEIGMVFPDEGKEAKIRSLLRKMRVYNYISSHYGPPYNAPVTQIIEDPVMRDSRISYFIQIADLVAHSLYRKIIPKASYQKWNVDLLFDRVSNLLVQQASKGDKYGIVYL